MLFIARLFSDLLMIIVRLLQLLVVLVVQDEWLS